MSTTPDQGPTTPTNPPSTPPVELYPMADIRFVLVRIGELGSKVDRLIDDVAKQGDKVSEVREKITFVKGAIWVFSTLFVVFMAIFGAYLSGKLQIKIR